MTLLVKVICPECGAPHDSAALGTEIRCRGCGRDFRAIAEGNGHTRILSVTPDELDSVPYSQRAVEVPVNKASKVILSDPTLLTDKLLRDVPVRDNAKYVGRVRLIKKIGQGGMGAVYHGFDEGQLLDVAVKILPLPLDERNAQFVERFRQEARISAKINHPNVVRVLQVDQQGELLYLVMDYVAGQTARNVLEAKGPLPVPRALQMIQDVVRGVQAAHEHGVIHRDIKPENILVADDGRVLLSDLGLAKAASHGSSSHVPVTRLGVLLGTPEYMSPEQWEIGANVGPPTDIWSLGASLWVLLTTKPPFGEGDLPALARAVKESPTPDLHGPRPEAGEVLCYIIERALAKRAEDRFASCAELLTAIDAALLESSSARGSFPLPQEIVAQRAKLQARTQPSAPAAPTLVPAPQPPKIIATPAVLQPAPALQAEPSHPALLKRAAIGAAALVLGALVLWTIWPSSEAPEQPTPAAFKPIISLDLRAPSRIKPGEDADLAATLNGVERPSDYSLSWSVGDKTYSGEALRLPLEHDAEFVVVVREKSSGSEVARRQFKVIVDLRVAAADKEFLRFESGTPLNLAGRVFGGSGKPDELEVRWINVAQPDLPLARSLSYALREPEIGRYVFVLQARRVSESWTQAVSDRVSVEVVKCIPPEFKAASQQAGEARRKATHALSGEDALEHWRTAVLALEQALVALPEAEDAKAQLAECRKLMAVDQKYVALLEEGRRLRDAAEEIPDSDGVRRLAAWSEALQPYTAALALFDRDEARTPALEVQKKLATHKTGLEAVEKERAKFDSIITRARSSAKEAKKYVSASVALPHWEQAMAAFQELSKSFPKRTDEFELEMKEVQENRDKAYLYENFGVVPGKLTEADMIKKPQPKDSPLKEMPPKEPAPKLPPKDAPRTTPRRPPVIED